MSRRRDRRSTRHFDDIPQVVQSMPGPSRLREQVPVQQVDRRQQVDGDSDPVVKEVKENEEEEEGDETWDNFTAEYYEVVEQLPLELHRNFALLQELDDQTQRHTTRLLNLLREYVAARLKPPIPELLRHPFPLPDEVAGTQLEIPQVDANNINNGSVDAGLVNPLPTDDKPPPSDTTPILPSNSQNGINLTEIAQPPISIASVSTKSYLPEIGKIARDLIRGSDEKVGIAVAAYNSVDRHIRAIDSALESQETNMIMGVRPDTQPSTAVEHGVPAKADHAISAGALGQREEGEVVIGLGGGGGGGGGGRKKGRANKRKRGKEMVVEEGPGGVVDLSKGGGLDMKIDPNEPRYCYCNNVSYGIMIGCDNDDCPMEWFHLACVGLTAEPTGHWWCDHCKPLQKKRK